jgi:hypothetical protein
VTENIHHPPLKMTFPFRNMLFRKITFLPFPKYVICIKLNCLHILQKKTWYQWNTAASIKIQLLFSLILILK